MCMRGQDQIRPFSTTQFPKQGTNSCLQSLHPRGLPWPLCTGEGPVKRSAASAWVPGLRNPHMAVHIPDLGMHGQSLRADKASSHPVLPLLRQPEEGEGSASQWAPLPGLDSGPRL